MRASIKIDQTFMIIHGRGDSEMLCNSFYLGYTPFAALVKKFKFDKFMT